ncbi:SRPBCC family protein [Sphingobium sp.]|uniref:SRPBCC family protein n=1 Tax=Sphingobium sp. TaxID=1912891 RepID=UPI002CEE5752|nr:SRPBCC family protein [Sphingobium sp.]HUD92951.1 SRPBCC family protein [Sphingobium sp.]
MAKVHRVSGYHQGKIDADIEAIWAVITDWGSLAWFDDGSNVEGMRLMESWLEGQPDVVPRTRVMGRGQGAVEQGAPEENREVLLLADPVAHRLYYDATDGFAPGIRNYIASWALDEQDDGGCLMTISSTFDVMPADLGEEQAAMLHGVYVAIVDSLQSYFARTSDQVKAG